MAGKIIKVLIIKDDIKSSDKEIYCLKLNLNEDLDGLKEKIYFRFAQNIFHLIFCDFNNLFQCHRCPLLKDLDYQIFWLGKCCCLM